MSINLPAHKVRGLGSVLRGDYIHFSPAVGLLASCAPSLISNLRKFPVSKPVTSGVAHSLFHQREDSNGRLFGPISVSKSKSNVAAWLRPDSIGCILGLGSSRRAINVCIAPDV